MVPNYPLWLYSSIFTSKRTPNSNSLDLPQISTQKTDSSFQSKAIDRFSSIDEFFNKNPHEKLTSRLQSRNQNGKRKIENEGRQNYF